MAKRTPPTEPEGGGILVDAAKAVGKAAGKFAALTGVGNVEHTSSNKAPRAKLQKKNKSRLPRREKKARQKTARRQM